MATRSSFYLSSLILAALLPACGSAEAPVFLPTAPIPTEQGTDCRRVR